MFGAHAAQPMRLHFLDVGQGDATLVELPCGAMLIDTGGEKNDDFDSVKALRTALDAFFARRTDLNRTLDAVLLTHPHIDHIRGLPMVLETLSVKRVIDNGHDPTGRDDPATPVMKWLRTWQSSHPDVAYRPVKASDFTGSGGLTDAHIDPLACDEVDPGIEVFWGGQHNRPLYWEDEAFHNQNNHSVVVKITYGPSTTLLTGDLEVDGIRSLLRDRNNALLDVDIYKVGHHGSWNGTTRELMDAMRPEVAVLSMGPENRHRSWTAWAYGHPRKDAVTLLERGVQGRRDSPVQVPVASGAKTFRTESIYTRTYGTGWSGTVVLRVDPDGTITKE